MVTVTGSSQLDAERQVPVDSPSRRVVRKLAHHPTGLVSTAGLVALIIVTVLAPWLAPYDPQAMNFEALFSPPSLAHPFGTDELGRDMLSRVIWGGRESLWVGVVGSLIALGGGIILGLVAGYYGRWLDMGIMRLMDIMLAFPAILLMISIIGALGPSLQTVLIAVGIALIPGYARLVRGSVLAAREQEYVLAARVLGVRNGAIMLKHILPNVIGPVIVYGTLGLGSSILITAGLSYIGLGAQPPTSEWGALLNSGKSHMRDAWWISVFPGVAIFVAVLCVNLLGDALRDALDVKM
jgi:ABC-type dipeptide/oligopeptide/nickel transport system permease subunit